MLKKLRAEALALIGAAPNCVLSTIGPAGVQASAVTCAVHDACVYVLTPSTADHLFNIEHAMEVVLTTTDWQLRGMALALQQQDGYRGTAPNELIARASAEGQVVIEIFPLRMHIEAIAGRWYRETIDFDLPGPNLPPAPPWVATPQTANEAPESGIPPGDLNAT